MVCGRVREDDIADLSRINPQGFNLVDDHFKRGSGPSFGDHAHLSHGQVGGEGRRSQLKQMGCDDKGFMRISVMGFPPYK